MNSPKHKIILCTILTLSILAGNILVGRPASAQIPSILDTKIEKETNPGDPLGRKTPRGTLQGFLKAATLDKNQEAKQYLQFPRNLSEIQQDELIQNLEYLINRSFAGSIDSISNQENGSINDGPNDDLEEIGTLQLEEDHQVSLILVRVPNEALGPLWLISEQTLKKIPLKLNRKSLPSIANILPSTWIEITVLKIPLWILITAPFFFLIYFGISWLLIHGLISLFRFIKRLLHKTVAPRHSKAARPFIFLLAFIFHYSTLVSFGLPILFQNYYARFIYILILFAILWFLFIIIDGLSGRVQQRLKNQGRYSMHSALLMVRKIIKVLIFIGFALAVIGSLGYNIDAALATLGIGGIAIAFAAQKSLENLFGGISLLTDQALRVGDLCRIGTYLGTVEDIGLRSTRIRTLDNTLLLVPNGLLSSEKLENYSRRKTFLFKHLLRLRYETQTKQMQEIMEKIRNLIQNHSKVEKNTDRVCFISFGTYSLDIEIVCYFFAKDYPVFLVLQEEILLKIMELVEAAGAKFGFPTQITYSASNTDLNPEAPQGAV